MEKHKKDFDIYKFGEYWGYQCICGELIQRFDNPKEHVSQSAEEPKGVEFKQDRKE